MEGIRGRMPSVRRMCFTSPAVATAGRSGATGAISEARLAAAGRIDDRGVLNTPHAGARRGISSSVANGRGGRRFVVQRRVAMLRDDATRGHPWRETGGKWLEY
jgi:hypothetical protein